MTRSTTVLRLRTTAALFLTAGFLAACAGENLFSIAGTTGASGPDVDITTPSDNLTKAVGDSLLIEANVSANGGAASVVYSANYEGGSDPAYTSETANLNGLTTVILSNYVRAAPGQTEGTAVVVVSVTDLAGNEGADTVKVTITN